MLRIVVGVIFVGHGAQKLFGAFGGIPPGMAPPFIIYGAGSLEFFGGILIALGLFARPVAFILSGMMACAYFIGHARNGFFPKTNGGELAVIFCWLYLYIAAQGPGAFALDNVWRRAQRAATVADGRA